ncbi:MAG: GNAT family N-acetyltransferase [Actinomycetaceae bacterium]|nr:GNAT family N-acetyltransferase [Actinomycetaceae bacterium]
MTFTTGANSAFWQLAAKPYRFSGAVAEHAGEDYAIAVEDDPWANNPGEQRMVAWGNPELVIPELLRLFDKFGPFARIMVSTDIANALTDEQRSYLAPYWGAQWDFFWTSTPLKPVPLANEVELYERGTDQYAATIADIAQALRAGNPVATPLSHLEEFDWFVLRENDSIMTVMGVEFIGNVAHFAGLGTVPDARGRGLGSATMVGAIDLALERVDHVEFGVWSWNTRAIDLYHRLGINHGGQIINGRHEPFEDLESQA